VSASDRLEARSAWSQLCDTLRKLGDVVLDELAADDALDAAEGMRFVTRTLHYLLEKEIEGSDALFPWLIRAGHETRKLLSASPDYHYRMARIDGRREYRLHGRRGSADRVALETYRSSNGGLLSTGSLQEPQLETDADGRFDLIVSSRPQPGNWLPATEQSSVLQLRNVFDNPVHEAPSLVSLELLGGPLAPALYTSTRFASDLRMAVAQFEATVRLMARFTRDLRARAYCSFDHDQSLWQSLGGNAATYYAQGYWALEPDEALVIECRIPACSYFSFQLNNFWAESLDYLHHPIYRNARSSTRLPDGSVRYVIAHRDPGTAGDWLDTAGHRHGTMVWRWNDATERPCPMARKLPLMELAQR
jgi:hypothetical protein